MYQYTHFCYILFLTLHKIKRYNDALFNFEHNAKVRC